MGKLISKKAIMVGNCDGFVGNRMIAPYAGEAKMVLEEGRIGERAPVVEFSIKPCLWQGQCGNLSHHTRTCTSTCGTRALTLTHSMACSLMYLLTG